LSAIGRSHSNGRRVVLRRNRIASSKQNVNPSGFVSSRSWRDQYIRKRSARSDVPAEIVVKVTGGDGPAELITLRLASDANVILIQNELAARKNQQIRSSKQNMDRTSIRERARRSQQNIRHQVRVALRVYHSGGDC